MLEQGRVIHSAGPESVLHHVARDKVGVRVMGYPVDELEIDMSRDLLHFGFVPSPANPPASATSAEAWLRIPAKGYALYDFGSVQGGFIEARLRCEAPTRVYLKFDEILNRPPKEIFKLGVGAIALDLEPGEHTFTSFEPYSMSTIRVIACDASIEVCAVRIREYAHPVPEPVSPSDDTELLPAELLYGLMLRFDLLQQAGERKRLVAELRHVFGPMARQSGTLWEHVEPGASLNHGFASYASALLLA